MVEVPQASQQALLIRQQLLKQACVEPARTRIDRHLAEAAARNCPLDEPTAAGPSETEQEDAAFWQRFAGQAVEAAQQLPKGAQAPDVHAHSEPIDAQSFMAAAKMVPQLWMRQAGAMQAMLTATPLNCAGRSTASVSPTSVDEAWHWTGADASSRGDKKRHIEKQILERYDVYKMEQSSSAKRTARGADDLAHAKKRSDAGMSVGERGSKRRRRPPPNGHFQSPPPKSGASPSTFLSPGQEAARNLLALRHGAL
jgi:hypothetical protein